VRRQDFSFDLPEELIAQSPLAERSASRMLVLDGATGGLADRNMGDLPSYLRAGDLLVFNDTRVVAARIVGAKPSGGRVEIFLERVKAGVANEALVQLRASKPIREGLEITTAGGVVCVVGREDELWRVETPGDALVFFETWGEVPLPPYIHRSADANDSERYQSIFAREKGAVAAPTASLHFDAPLVAKLEAMGVGRAFVTLHVGAGTFQPLRTDDLDAHKMHAERVSVGAPTWEAIQRTHTAGGRVIAVGTTVVRALESAALHVGERASVEGEPAPVAGELAPDVGELTADAGVLAPDAGGLSLARAAGAGANRARESVALHVGEQMSDSGQLAPDVSKLATDARELSSSPSRALEGGANRALESTALHMGDQASGVGKHEVASGVHAAVIWSGETRLFIRPGFEFQVVDAMVTNFHLPESTLLMLVSAFAGREHVLAAYAHAVRERYRFFSYGDAMLVMPTHTRPTQSGPTKTQPTRALS
jgi:S-adenosylmethionine:tRNA ribosyltransferase-isomerase